LYLYLYLHLDMYLNLHLYLYLYLHVYLYLYLQHSYCHGFAFELPAKTRLFFWVALCSCMPVSRRTALHSHSCTGRVAWFSEP
jgi:hypothetical protein